MGLLHTEDVVLGGMTFTIRVLPLQEGRKIYARIQRQLAGVFAADAGGTLGLSPLMLSGMTGQLESADLEALCAAFGATTTVRTEDGRTLVLNDKGQNEIFAGAYDLMFDWLDACVAVNFKGVVEKLKGAQRNADAAGLVKSTAP